MQRGELDNAWRALSAIANFILILGGIAIALLMTFSRPLAALVAPGFTGPGELDTLTHLIRIILPAQLFLIVGGLLSAALQAQDRHVLPAAETKRRLETVAPQATVRLLPGIGHFIPAPADVELDFLMSTTRHA